MGKIITGQNIIFLAELLVVLAPN